MQYFKGTQLPSAQFHGNVPTNRRIHFCLFQILRQMLSVARVYGARCVIWCERWFGSRSRMVRVDCCSFLKVYNDILLNVPMGVFPPIAVFTYVFFQYYSRWGMVRDVRSGARDSGVVLEDWRSIRYCILLFHGSVPSNRSMHLRTPGFAAFNLGRSP